MKSHLLIVTATIGLAISGCQTNTDKNNPSLNDEVIRNAVKICKFEPLVSTVVGLVAAFGGPNLAPADAVAKEICAAVEKKSGLRGAPPGGIYGEARGIPVRGQFVM